MTLGSALFLEDSNSFHDMIYGRQCCYGEIPLTIAQLAEEHTKNARPSSKGKHEQGNARRMQDAGNEKGDKNRRPPKQRPPNYKGPWPAPKQDPT